MNRFYGFDDRLFDENIDRQMLVSADTSDYDLVSYQIESFNLPPFFMFKNKNSPEEQLFLNQRSGYLYYDYEEKLIDLEVFNRIVSYENLEDRTHIAELFLHYIHYWPYSNESNSNILHKEILTREDEEWTYYYQVYHDYRGLVDYCFYLNPTKLKKVESIYLGYSDEYPQDVIRMDDHRPKVVTSKKEKLKCGIERRV